MKKFIHKVQNLSQRAAELQRAVQSAPAKAAELRESVLAAAGQLQQLRADVQSSVNNLRTEGDDRLTHALREVDESHGVFAEGGYAVHEVEMELGLAQRLVVHLEKVADVPHAAIRSLLAAHDSRTTTHAILTALLKAEELADKVHLSHLTYHKLTVYAGLTPSVRLCWGTEEELAAHPVTAPSATAGAPPPLPAASAFTQSSYFERAAPAAAAPPSPAASAPVPAAPAPAAKPASAAESKEPAATSGDFGRSALDRFKKMPDLSKYRR